MAKEGIYYEFGGFVRNLRKAKGIKQLEGSNKLGGTSNLLNAIEYGSKKPTPKLVEKLSTLFEVDEAMFAEFLKEKPKKKNEEKESEEFVKAIGKRVKNAKERMGLKSIELAAELNIPRDHFSRIESGSIKPNLIIAQKLARRLLPQYPEPIAIGYFFYGFDLGKTKDLIQEDRIELEFLRAYVNELKKEIQRIELK